MKTIGVGVKPGGKYEIDMKTLTAPVDDILIDAIQDNTVDTDTFDVETIVELDTKDISNMIMKFIKGDDTLSFQFVIHEELVFQEGIKKKAREDVIKRMGIIEQWQDEEYVK